MMRPDHTHDPQLRSWVGSANRDGTDFPIQNLPYGVVQPPGEDRTRVVVAIGDEVLDLTLAAELGQLGAGPAAAACQSRNLNGLMQLGSAERLGLRHRVSALLAMGATLASDERLRKGLLLPAGEVKLVLPAAIGDYTDFYASVFHAGNVGRMFRPDNPLLPNYKWVPIGYHGRASSVVASGHSVRRPCGQTKPADAPEPRYGPSAQLDYELEVGAWIAGENPLGQPVAMREAEGRIFGLSLLNDWSARDMQAWEYQPLGPFLAKSFLTTVSPWVITAEALAPFRVPAWERPAGDPEPLPYLDSEENRSSGGFGVTLEVSLRSARMREAGMEAARVSRSDFGQLYWTVAQLVAHHASNGCNLGPGDLLGSGTVSGPERDQRGCLLELTWRGAEPLRLPTGEERRWLEDGDEVIMRGWCERQGATRIGFGECRGIVRSAEC
jgi:fumarylacetoacetase